MDFATIHSSTVLSALRSPSGGAQKLLVAQPKDAHLAIRRHLEIASRRFRDEIERRDPNETRDGAMAFMGGSAFLPPVTSVFLGGLRFFGVCVFLWGGGKVLK